MKSEQKMWQVLPSKDGDMDAPTFLWEKESKHQDSQMKKGQNLEDSPKMRSKAMKNSTNISKNKPEGFAIRHKVHQEKVKSSPL